LHCSNEVEQKNELCYKEILLSALIILFFACIFFWQPIITGSTVIPAGNIFEQDFYHPYAPEGYSGPPNSLLQDQSHQLYPMHHFAMQSLANGKLPLWNPHIMLGSSVLGTTISAPLYPPNLLGIILAPTTVILIRAIFNLWVAGFLMYILIRRLGANSFGAFIAAIAFMFCGFLTVWLGHPHSNSAIWLPGMILMAELIVTSRYKRCIYASITGILIALSFLGSHMETTFEITLAWFLYLMVRSFQVGGWKKVINNLWMAIFSVVLGLSVSAVQVFPFLEWLGTSVQLSERSSVDFIPFFTGFWRNCLTLTTLVLPNLYGNPSQTSLYVNYLPWSNFNEMAIYVGIIPLVLGLYGMSLRENKHIKIFTWGALLFLALALRLPLIDWINQLPIFKLFAAGRYRLIFDFGIAVAAGLAIDAWMRKSYDPVHWRKLSRFLLLLGVTTLAIILLMIIILPIVEKPITDLGKSLVAKQYAEIRVHRRTLEEVLLVVDQVFQGMLNHFSLMNWKLYFPGLAACLGGLWIIIWQRAWFSKTIFKFGIVFLVLIDLLIFGIGYNPSIRPEFVYPDTPAVKFLKQDQSLFRIMPIVMQWMSNGPLAHGISEVGGMDQITKYFHNFRNVIAVTYPFSTMDTTMFVPIDANSRLMDLLNVKYIVTTKELEDSVRKDFQLIWQDNKIRIYKNSAVMQRAFFVNSVRYLTDDDMLKALGDPSFDPAAEVLLSLQPGKEITMSAALPRDQRISITKYEPERVQISTTTSGEGMLVISDAYYPGWNAYMDGEEVPIFRANYVMRAISLPKGHHDIEFRYEPLSVIWGFAISLTALILMGIISIVSFRKFRKVKDEL
jgi:hypothetical protein